MPQSQKTILIISAGGFIGSHLVDIEGEGLYPRYDGGDRLPPDINRMRAPGWLARHGLRKTLRRGWHRSAELGGCEPLAR